MAGKIDIINMALSRLGLPAISGITDPTPHARLAAREFDNTKDCVLRDFQWGFASRTVDAAPLTQKPATGWKYAYAYPGDCLFVRKLLFGGHKQDYEVGDQDGITVIYADASPVKITYTRIVDNSERFDSLFVDALAWRLAVPLATGISVDMQKAQAAETMYQSAISRARVGDAEEEEMQERPISSYEAGRI